jgi:hypothetical protein
MRIVFACALAALAGLAACSNPPEASGSGDATGESSTGEGACEGRECSGHGKCVVDEGEPRCLCDEGYFERGDMCISLPDEEGTSGSEEGTGTGTETGTTGTDDSSSDSSASTSLTTTTVSTSTSDGDGGLLPDGTPCESPEECASGHCWSDWDWEEQGPGPRVCKPECIQPWDDQAWCWSAEDCCGQNYCFPQGDFSGYCDDQP